MNEIDRKTSAARFLPDLRQAGRAGIQAILLQALRGYRSQSLAFRRLCGPGEGRDEDEDGERPAEGEAGEK